MNRLTLNPGISPMDAQIKRKTAVRKFFAIPVTIVCGTAGAIYAAHFARLSIDLANYYNGSWLTDYWLATVIGIVISTFLAYTAKEFLNMQGHFKLEYILAATAFIVLTTATLSFAANSVFFFSVDTSTTHAGQKYDYHSAPIYQGRSELWSYQGMADTTHVKDSVTYNTGRF
jgi:hypothetical protein